MNGRLRLISTDVAGRQYTSLLSMSICIKMTGSLLKNVHTKESPLKRMSQTAERAIGHGVLVSNKDLSVAHPSPRGGREYGGSVSAPGRGDMLVSSEDKPDET